MSDTPTTTKRHRTMAETSYDIRLHTLVPYSPTVGCVRITMPDTPLTKDDTISLVVVADASGSMADGNRMANMREGIMRLGELSGRFASMQVELTIIRFSDTADIVWGPAPVPSDEKLQQICSDIKPRGGTNMNKAIELAVSVAEARSFVGKSVHMILFTDGADTSSLATKISDGTAACVDQLKTAKRITTHCVGICSDADATLLELLSRTACRGTFQCIKDNDIAKLIGCMWALMMEMIDSNVRLVVECFDADGTNRAIVSRDVILRVCDPPLPLTVGFKVPQATTMLRARMVIEERCLETRIDLPRQAEPAFDIVCAQEAVNLLQGELSERIVALLRAGNPSDAVMEIGNTRQVIQELLEKVEVDQQRAEFSSIVDTVMKELDASEAEMILAINDYEGAREAELRAMSRTSTARNSGVSIVPDGVSLSALQRQLSA
jgi:hypothetical protein